MTVVRHTSRRRRAARRLHRARRDLERIQSERDEAEAALFHGPEIDQSDPIAAGLALRRLDRLAAAKGSEKERLLADPDYQDAALLDLQLARVSGQRADRLRREVAERQDPGRAGALEFEMEAADLLATAIERIESAIADASRLSVRALRQTLPDEDEDDDESVFDDQQEQKEEPKDYLATRLHEVFGTVEQ
jgi:hypothetical protein